MNVKLGAFSRNVLVVADKTIFRSRESVVLQKMSVKNSTRHLGLKFRSGHPRALVVANTRRRNTSIPCLEALPDEFASFASLPLIFFQCNIGKRLASTLLSSRPELFSLEIFSKRRGSQKPTFAPPLSFSRRTRGAQYRDFAPSQYSGYAFRRPACRRARQTFQPAAL